MEHAMVKDATGSPFCLCGFLPPREGGGLWQAKHDVLSHITDERKRDVPEFAEKVTLDLQQKKLFINGAEFPWFISEDGVDLLDLGTENRLASVVVSIPAGSVEVIPEDGHG